MEKRCRGIEVERVAELVLFRRADRFDAGRLLARVVPSEAALAQGSEQIAKRAVPEKIERLVGHLERDRRLIGPEAARTALAPLAFAVEVGRGRDVAFLRHALDDLLNQLFELGA